MTLLFVAIAFVINLNHSKADVIGADMAASLTSKLGRIAVDKVFKEGKKYFEVNQYAQRAKHLLYTPAKAKVLSLKEGALRNFLDKNYKQLKQKIPNNNETIPDNVCINILEVISKTRKLQEIEASKRLAYNNAYDARKGSGVRSKMRILNRKFFRMNTKLGNPITSVENKKLENYADKLNAYGRKLANLETKAENINLPNSPQTPSRYDAIINDLENQKHRCPNLPNIGESEKIHIKSGSDIILERAHAAPVA